MSEENKLPRSVGTPKTPRKKTEKNATGEKPARKRIEEWKERQAWEKEWDCLS